MSNFKPARLIKALEGWQGDAALYELSEPLDGHTKVVVSAICAPFSGYETLIFPWNEEKNTVTDFMEIGGIYSECSHKNALANVGFYIEDA